VGLQHINYSLSYYPYTGSSSQHYEWNRDKPRHFCLRMTGVD